MHIEVIYKNNYGYSIDILVEEYNWDTDVWEPKNLSPFSTLKYKIKKPDNTIVKVTPSFKTDGTDGFLTYVTTSGNVIFDQRGTYRIQAELTSSDKFFSTTVYSVEIHNPLGG